MITPADCTRLHAENLQHRMAPVEAHIDAELKGFSDWSRHHSVGIRANTAVCDAVVMKYRRAGWRIGIMPKDCEGYWELTFSPIELPPGANKRTRTR